MKEETQICFCGEGYIIGALTSPVQMKEKPIIACDFCEGVYILEQELKWNYKDGTYWYEWVKKMSP